MTEDLHDTAEFCTSSPLHCVYICVSWLMAKASQGEATPGLSQCLALLQSAPTLSCQGIMDYVRDTERRTWGREVT